MLIFIHVPTTSWLNSKQGSEINFGNLCSTLSFSLFFLINFSFTYIPYFLSLFILDYLVQFYTFTYFDTCYFKYNIKYFLSYCLEDPRLSIDFNNDKTLKYQEKYNGRRLNPIVSVDKVPQVCDKERLMLKAVTTEFSKDFYLIIKRFPFKQLTSCVVDGSFLPSLLLLFSTFCC